MSALCNVPLCMDGRMLAPGGTGVSTYARALRSAQISINSGARVLEAMPQAGMSATARLIRVAHALSPVTRSTRVRDDTVLGHDVFRLAQVFFDIHRRPMTVRIPGPPGLMHWAYPVPLRIAGWHNVYTVHDVIPLSDPDLTPIASVRYRRVLAGLIDRAAAIVTVSEASRGQIAEHLGPLAIPLVNCAQPVEITTDVQPLPAGLETKRYLLVCGSVEPRKNIARLLAAYRASGSTLPLVVAGPAGWQAAHLERAMAETPNIVRLAEVSRGPMLALIRNARALLMPSLAEGFGLPVAEAMALGTAVLTSQRGALAETAAGAALLVDPESGPAIADGIRRLADDGLVANLETAGLARAAAFRATDFSARLDRLYAELVAEQPPHAYPSPAKNEELACGASQ